MSKEGLKVGKGRSGRRPVAGSLLGRENIGEASNSSQGLCPCERDRDKGEVKEESRATGSMPVPSASEVEGSGCSEEKAMMSVYGKRGRSKGVEVSPEEKKGVILEIE